MAIPGFVSLIFAPVFNSYITKIGIELTVLSVAFTFGGGYVILGLIAQLNDHNLFILFSALAFVLIGYSIAANLVSE